MAAKTEVVVSAFALRSVLCTILRFNQPSDPDRLIGEFVGTLGDDFTRNHMLDVATAEGLRDRRALVLADLAHQMSSYGVVGKDLPEILRLSVEDREIATRLAAPARAPSAEPQLVRDELDFDAAAQERLYRSRARGTNPTSIYVSFTLGFPPPPPPYQSRSHNPCLEFAFQRARASAARAWRLRVRDHTPPPHCARCAPPAGLTLNQTAVVSSVVRALDGDVGGCFYIDAPGGAGKTWCLNTLLAYARSKNKPALAVASSGIAALLLGKGRTSHSRFKLSRSPTGPYALNISTASRTALARLLQLTELIVWDESSASVKFHFQALDTFLRDLMRVRGHAGLARVPFGGKVVVAAGDFRQTLPIEKRASDERIATLTLPRSSLWRHFTVLRMRDNMRLRTALTPADTERLSAFAAWQMSVGDGTHDGYDDDAQALQLDPLMCISLRSGHRERASSVRANSQAGLSPAPPGVYDMIEWAFGNMADLSSARSHAILTPRNADVELINDAILQRIPGELVTLSSADRVIEKGDDGLTMGLENLHVTPPHPPPPTAPPPVSRFSLAIVLGTQPRACACFVRGSGPKKTQVFAARDTRARVRRLCRGRRHRAWHRTTCDSRSASW